MSTICVFGFGSGRLTASLEPRLADTVERIASGVSPLRIVGRLAAFLEGEVRP